MSFGGDAPTLGGLEFGGVLNALLPQRFQGSVPQAGGIDPGLQAEISARTSAAGRQIG